MIYVICLDTTGFQQWRESVGFEPSNRHCMMLRTKVDGADKVRGRVARQGDTVIRWGAYHQGPYWHEIEDALAVVFRVVDTADSVSQDSST